VRGGRLHAVARRVVELRKSGKRFTQLEEVRDRASGNRDRPAAIYAVDAFTLLASYEPCAASGELPRIRYVRRDVRGGVVTDVMLRREAQR
jgi:hypothetical protein